MTCFAVNSWNKNITQMRQKQKTTLCFISDIHIHAIYESGKKQRLFSSSPWTILGYIQYKGHCTKRNAQVLCCKLQTWSFFPLLSYSSTLRFCLWQMEVHTRVGSRYNHSLDKGCFGHIKRILVGHSRGHEITFFFNKNRHGLSSLEIPSRYI